MKKAGSTFREWLEETIAMCGGPSNCPDDFQLHDKILIVVNTRAAWHFQTAIVADNGITVKEYLAGLERSCSES